MKSFKSTFATHSGLLGILLLISSPTLVTAQDMSKYYTVTHPDEFEIDWTGFYNLMTEKTARIRNELPHHLNLPYGAHPKQKLDIYLPRGTDLSSAPVFLFLHGGGFREGDRAQYGAIAAPFAKHGIITAVASYRLTEDGFHYPDQPNDMKAAIKWIFENISQYGGDRESIYAGGHSAGAILSADIGGNRDWMEQMWLPKEILKGIVPVSGPYDLREGGRPGERSAYAPTPELLEQASPILHVNDPVPAAIVAVGSVEKYQQSSLEFVEKLQARGCRAEYLLLEGEDHKDTALSLANPESELFQAVLRMITR
jgi:acetyl esterase/lipase